MDNSASFSANSYFFACYSIKNADTRPDFDIAHPDMDIFINTDKSPALIQAKATGSPLSAFKVKRGAVVPLSVTVLDTQTATGLRMGIKTKGNYEGDLLILAEADSGTQTESGTRFDLKLIASSLALNDALLVGGHVTSQRGVYQPCPLK